MENNEILSKIYGLKINYKCKKCNSEQQIPIFPYIDFSKNPEYYAKVKNLDIFKVKCEKCGFQEMIKYDTLLVNPTYKYFLYFFTNSDINLFRNNVEYFVNTVLNKNEIKNWNLITTRLVLTLNDLVEKMAIFEIGLNDKAIEFIKYSLKEKGHTSSKNVDLLFDGVNQTNLEFIEINNDTNKSDKILVNILLYNNIIENVNKLKDDKINFDLINQDWVLKKLE